MERIEEVPPGVGLSLSINTSLGVPSDPFFEGAVLGSFRGRREAGGTEAPSLITELAT